MVLPGVCCLPLSEYLSVIRFIRAATIRYPNTKNSILGASMEKRAFIAVGLSIAVFYLFSMMFGPDKQKVVPSAPQGTTSVANNPTAKSQLPSVLPESCSALGTIASFSLPSKRYHSRYGTLYGGVFFSRSEHQEPDSEKIS